MRTGISTSKLTKDFLKGQREKGITYVGVYAIIKAVAKHFEWTEREANKQIVRLIEAQEIDIQTMVR